MRQYFTGGRALAAAASSLAFIATFVVGARAVIADETEKKTFVVVIIETDQAAYHLGQKVEVVVPANSTNQLIEIADGVWVEPSAETPDA